jgi:hypothetical protein
LLSTIKKTNDLLKEVMPQIRVNVLYQSFRLKKERKKERIMGGFWNE